MLRMTLVFALAALLAGCAGKPIIYKDSNSITIEHKKKGFREAMEEARQHCLMGNKVVKHDGTDCPDKCISTFVCVAPQPTSTLLQSFSPAMLQRIHAPARGRDKLNRYKTGPVRHRR